MIKLFPVLILSAIIAYVSAADTPVQVNQYLGELQDFEGGFITLIQNHYRDDEYSPLGSPPRKSPPRQSDCITRPSLEVNAACSEICVNRSHKGGSCKGKVCLCVD